MDGDLRSVDERIGFQIVEHAGEAPCPDADGRVVFMAAFEAIDIVEKRQCTTIPRGGVIRENIVIASGYGCITTGDRFAEAPKVFLRGAFVMIRFVFWNETGTADIQFIDGELVAAEVQTCECGHGLRGVFRNMLPLAE